MLGICAVVLVCWALSVAQSVFAPLAFALFVIALVWPLQRRLQQALPKLLALALTMAATILVVIIFSSLIAWAVSRIARFVANDAARLQDVYNSAVLWLENRGIVFAELWSEHINSARLIRLAQEITSRLNTATSFLVIVFIYVLIGLLEVDEVGQRLRSKDLGTLGSTLLAGGAQTASKLRQYMLVRTLMSIMTGLLVWAFAGLAGLPLAAEWGVLAFALNYIPFIGPFIATLFPTLFAMAQFGSLRMAVPIFICLNVIQFVVGSYLEPRVAGRALAISPFVVLFAVFFWTFLWGLPGAFIGVPIVIAIISLCEQHPSSRWVSDLFGHRANAHA
jgi:predicted PurR-regulated permease PerM